MKKIQFKKIAILGIVFVSIIISGKVLKASAEKNIENDMKCTVQEKIKNWSDYITSDDHIAKLSNPYEYFKNEKYKEIKMLGPEYLPYIINEIETNKNARVLIWAINDISSMKFKKLYCSDDEFVESWNNYIDNLPSEFNALKNELENCKTQEEMLNKNNEIVELGYPVLPLVMEEVISGNDKMRSAVDDLVDNVQSDSIYKTIDDDKELKTTLCKKVYNEDENKKMRSLSELKIDVDKFWNN